jgi:predicted transglutaminase-like cysteine proteinase
MTNIFGTTLSWLKFQWPPVFDGALERWWRAAWPTSKVYYRTQDSRAVWVPTVLYTDVAGWIGLSDVVAPLRVLEADGVTLNEDATFRKIRDHINTRIVYQEDIAQYGQNEFWQDAWQTYQRRRGDCDDVAILIKLCTLVAGIPDYRVKCCCLDLLEADGSDAGGHMNLLYLSRATNTWSFQEGTWRNQPLSTYGPIWFTFTRAQSWAQHTLTFDRSDLRKRLARETLS